MMRIDKTGNRARFLTFRQGAKVMEPGWDSSSDTRTQVTGKTGLRLAVLAGLVYLTSSFINPG